MDALQQADTRVAEDRSAEGKLMDLAGGKDCRGDRSANWVTHNGCDKKNPLRDVQKVP